MSRRHRRAIVHLSFLMRRSGYGPVCRKTQKAWRFEHQASIRNSIYHQIGKSTSCPISSTIDVSLALGDFTHEHPKATSLRCSPSVTTAVREILPSTMAYVSSSSQNDVGPMALGFLHRVYKRHLPDMWPPSVLSRHVIFQAVIFFHLPNPRARVFQLFMRG